MGKRCRESDSDDATTETVEHKTVFFDTNLDTYLAMPASGSETLLDIKKKLVSQHMQLFPTVGEIKIHSLKVKLRSNFYHLPDIMHLSNAFEGNNGIWHLYVDASIGLKNRKLGLIDCVKENGADDCRGLVSAVKQMETLPMALPKDADATNKVSEVASGVKFTKSLGKASGTHENCVESEHHVKKKRKMKHAVDVRNDQSNVKSTTANSKLDSDKGKAVGLTLNAVLDCSMRSMDATDVKEDMKSDGNKRKKEKGCRMAPEILSKIHVEQTGTGEITQLCSETQNSEVKYLSLDHDIDVTTLSSNNSLHNALPDVIQKGISLPCVLDASTAEAPVMGSGSKKKRKKKHKKNKEMERVEKSTDAYPEKSGVEQSIDGSSIDLISEASDKKGSTLHHKGLDVQMNLLDGSSKYASEKIQVADKNGSDFVASIQSNQALDDIALAENIVKKTQTSLGNVHEGFPVEKDLILGSNQVEKNGKNIDGNDKIVKKKGKRVKLSTSDVKMKDADDFKGLSSDVNRLEALPMTMLNHSHEKNHVPSDVKNGQLNAEVKADSSYLNSNKSKEDMVLEDTMPENFVASKLEVKSGIDVPTDSLGVSSNEVPDCNTGLMGANGAVENVSSNISKRKKKKSHKTAVEIQDKTFVGQTANVESTKLYTETHKPEENKGEKTMPLDHNHEVTIPSNKTDLDTAVLHPAQNKSVSAHAVVESAISGGCKKNKKKRGGNSADSDLEKLGNEQYISGISGSSGLCLSPPEAGGKEEDTLLHKEQDVQMKLLDSSTKDASEQVQGADGNEENLVLLTQSSQIPEDVTSADKIVENTETGQNTGNKDKKSKKRKKKVQNTASDVMENLPVEVQNAGVQVSPTEESLGDPVRSVGLSSAPSNKSEEKVNEMHRTDANTGDLSRTSENGGEGINLKQHHQCQDKDSGNEEKKATKSSSKKRDRGVQENALLPASISTKSFDDKESEDQSCVRKSSDRRPGNSIHKSSVQDEEIPNSSKIVSGVEVKDSTPSEMHQTEAFQKCAQVHAAPPCPKDFNASLNKSGLERSERQGSRRAQTDATKKMVMKTPRKKSLLIKPGAIFQDNSGESSGDENGILCSASSARRPSESPALSSDSESIGESDLSQESNRNGLDDPKNQSTAGRNASKLDNLSDSGEVTMDMILRSSKRFKNAKLLASQNEVLEPIEYVPESQLD